jgi:AcrR family transcriptional regulator
MGAVMSDVKARRRYDSSRRLDAARRNREAVLDAAERLFLTDGYSRATVAAIAEQAGVSTELIYKAYGGKSGLMKVIYERRLAGAGPVPAYQRSDDMREQQTDPRAIMREWGLLTAEVAAELTPIRLLLRAAATIDQEMADLLARTESERLDRMRHHAQFLAKRNYLRPDLSLSEATDILWACSSTEFYELLVMKRNWPLTRFAQFITDFMTARLLPPQQPCAKGTTS